MWVASPANFHLQGWRTARYQVMTSGSLVWWMRTGLGRRAWSFRTGFGGTFRLIDFEMPEYCSLTGANAPNTSISFLYLHINIVFPCYFPSRTFLVTHYQFGDDRTVILEWHAPWVVHASMPPILVVYSPSFCSLHPHLTSRSQTVSGYLPLASAWQICGKMELAGEARKLQEVAWTCVG